MSLPVSIDSLKSTIGARGGLARGNRFAIYMTYPGGPGLINTDVSSLISNLTGGGGFKSFFNDPRDLFLLCESCQIPGRRIMTMDQFHTHFSVKRPYSNIVDEVMFTFNLTNDYFVRKYFDEWQSKIIDQQGSPRLSYLREYASDVIIQQLTPSNDVIPSYQIKLKNAYPIAVNAIALSNTSENSILQCSVTLAYDDWVTPDIGDNIVDLVSIGSKIVQNTVDQFF
jgi:hypothetical protein